MAPFCKNNAFTMAFVGEHLVCSRKREIATGASALAMTEYHRG